MIGNNRLYSKGENMPQQKNLVPVIIVMAILAISCSFLTEKISNLTGEQDTQSLAETNTAETIAALPPTEIIPPTVAQLPTQALTEKPPATKTPKPTQVPTRDTGSQATAQAQLMADFVASLQTQGNLGNTEGTYYALDDFEDSLAQINYWQWNRTDYSPKNFVVRSKVEWASASETANWDYSGCGFIFRENVEKSEYYMLQLGLDGFIWAGTSVAGKTTWANTQKHLSLDIPEGNAELVVIVNGTNVTALVNGQEAFQTQNNFLGSRLTSGPLSFMLNSGTNAGFGTRCKWTNVELWELSK